MSSPFGCNQKNTIGSAFSGKAKETAPPEPVIIVVDKSQVVTAIIPFGTKHAAAIRSHMHGNILIDGQKCFIYRNMNGWTNIGLESTATAPRLTFDPITVLKKAVPEFDACPFVSTVTIKWTDGTTINGYDAIDGLDGMFDPLPVADESPQDMTDTRKTDGEILHECLVEMDKKVDTVDGKLAHVVSVVDKLYKSLVDDDSDVQEIVSSPPERAVSNRGKNNGEASGSETVVSKRRKVRA